MDRFLKGVAYIEDNLFERFTVSQVASAAGLSIYHYCRLFQSLTGESVMGYARKRRLTDAALRLTNGSNARLIELALDCGFESQAAFTRAFKGRLGMAPGAFRRAGRRWSPRHRWPFDAAALEHLREGITMEPKIIELEDIHTVGLKGDFEQDTSSQVPDLWRRWWPHVKEVKHQVPARYLGITEMTDMEKGSFTYTAAAQVTKIENVPDGLVGATFPGGRFAVFTHRLASPDIGADLRRTFQYIYGTWVPKSDVELRAYYDLELYDERFDNKTLSGEIDIYVPIK